MEERKTSKARSIFSTANKYQEKIVMVAFIPSAVTFLFFFFVVIVGNPLMKKLVFNVSAQGMRYFIYFYAVTIVLILCVIIILSLAGAFIVSHHLVGSFGRIIRELDDVIEGKSKKPITCRPGDELASDLLKKN